MKCILVTTGTSTFDGRSLHNRIAWRTIDGTRAIIAIGAPDEWNSPTALPSTAVVTDLVTASVEDPPLARLLWGEFLGYLMMPSMPAWYSMLPRFIRPSMMVSIKIPDVRISSAVRSAIESSCERLRFKIET